LLAGIAAAGCRLSRQKQNAAIGLRACGDEREGTVQTELTAIFRCPSNRRFPEKIEPFD
jgi:hypothetical protein